MRFDSVSGESGVSASDLRRALGPTGLLAKCVTITVLGEDGCVARAKVKLIDKRSGRALHRLFACPSCSSPSQVLRVQAGRFTCGRCRPHRTAHQREWFTRWWRRDDGELLDQLVRLSVRRSAARRTLRMKALAQQIIDHDRSRLEALAADARRLCQ